jgi:hypothetical protein
VRDLLREKDSSATVELSAIKERFGQQVARQLSRLKSGFLAVGVCVEGVDGLLDVLVNIGIACIVVER